MATAADVQRPGTLLRVRAAAQRPVPADSVAVLRVCFGLLVAYAAFRFVAKGWVEALYLAPEHHLTYTGFGWVRPLPGPLMYAEVLGLGALGLCIAAGYRHRLAAALFVVGFAHIELIDASLYLNHYWFVTLMALLLAALPVHHRWSLDARAGRARASSTVPALVVWAMRAQVGVVYVFAGLAKLNPEWLGDALPLRLWLADDVGMPGIGPLLAERGTAYVFSWAGMLFDLTIVLWLSWRRTRPFAYAAVVVFHTLTGLLFPIGVFPWVMIAMTPVFFEPDWPQRVLGRWRSQVPAPPLPPATTRSPGLGRPVTIALVLLAAVQLALPLRHLAYPGDVRWNEEGAYGAWRVMLTEKTGHLEFRVRVPGRRVRIVDPSTVLTDWQLAQAAIRPDLLHAAAHLVADRFRTAAGEPAVYADAFVSFLGRPAQRLVDPHVDLAALPRTLGHQAWVLPVPPP